MNTWRLIIRFETNSPCSFHVGSGYGHAGRVDRSVVRDSQGFPFIPGSTLRGKLRHAARETAEALGYVVCAEHCLPGADKPPCIVCRLFGSPFAEGELFVSDAVCDVRENPVLGVPGLLREDVPRIWEERHGVAIDRRLRTARHGSLFVTECAPIGLVLKATLEGRLDEKSELRLLRAAVRTLRWLGADSSRGLGGCQCEIQ